MSTLGLKLDESGRSHRKIEFFALEIGAFEADRVFGITRLVIFGEGDHLDRRGTEGGTGTSETGPG